jgi:hypothetical protein
MVGDDDALTRFDNPVALYDDEGEGDGGDDGVDADDGATADAVYPNGGGGGRGSDSPAALIITPLRRRRGDAADFGDGDDGVGGGDAVRWLECWNPLYDPSSDAAAARVRRG